MYLIIKMIDEEAPTKCGRIPTRTLATGLVEDELGF